MAVGEIAVGEQVGATLSAAAVYSPEGNLPDLLTPARQAGAPAESDAQQAADQNAVASVTAATSISAQKEPASTGAMEAASESTALSAPVQAINQQTATDQIVEALHGSEPPPGPAENIHLTTSQPVQSQVVQTGSTLSGNGCILGDLLNKGILSPGNSPGIVNVTGDTLLDSAGSLHIQIGGLTPGPGSPNVDDGYDQLNVSGAVTLGGTLQIDLINNFTPTVGDSFTIMTYGSATGSFDTVNGLIIGKGLVFKLEQSPTDLRLVVTDPISDLPDILSTIDSVLNAYKNGTISGTYTVNPGDVQLGGILGIQSPAMTFDFSYSGSSWSGAVTITAAGASFQIGSAFTASVTDADSDGIALTGTYSLNSDSTRAGSFSLTADKLTLDIPSLMTADAAGVTLQYAPNGAANQELVHINGLDITITPLEDTTVKVDNLSIRADGFSLGNATASTSSVTLSSVISIQTISISFDSIDYSATTGVLQGTFSVSAASVSMFPGQTAFTSTVTGFNGSYTLSTGALYLSADSASFQIGDLLKITAQAVTFQLDPFQITIDGVAVSSPRFPQLTGSASGFLIDSTGFSIASATVSYSAPVNIGSVLSVSDLSITATSFGYSVGAGGQFNGTLTVSVGSAQLFPGKSVNGSATGIVVIVDLSPGHEGELSFTAATVTFTLGDVFVASATNVSIDPTPGPGQLAFSFSRISAGLPQYGITGTLGDTGTDPSAPASFGFDADGKIQVLAGASFGFSFGTATDGAASSLKWPEWLPVQISALSVAWPDITNAPADFVLTFSASVSRIENLPLSVSGSVRDIVIDVGRLLDGEFPIVSVGSVSVNVAGEMFGGTISATLLAGIVRYDSEKQEVDINNKRIGSGTDAVGPVTCAFYAGIRGEFALGGLSGFKLSIGFSAAGPLSVYVSVALPTGILLEPNSGLTINDLRGGVDFYQTLPDIPDPDTGTAEDALQLRRDEFDSPASMDDSAWEAALRQAVINAAGASGWDVFSHPMIIRAGATLYSQYTSDKVFRADVDLAFDTQGRILISGQAVFADSLSLGIKLFANLSPVIDGSVNTGNKVTILFLSDFPSDGSVSPILSVYGRADFFFSRSDGTPVTSDSKADQFEIYLAGAAAMNVMDQLTAKFSGSLSLAFSSTGFVMKTDALLNVSYLGDIGAAAGELHVQKLSGSSLDIWGAFLVTANLSTMEQSGIYVSGLVFFSLNTTSTSKPITLTLPATPPDTPVDYPLVIKPQSFGLLIDGQAAFKLPKSSESDPSLFSMTAVLAVDINTTGLQILAIGTVEMAAVGGQPLLKYNVNGLLVVNANGVAARLTLEYSSSAIPGAAFDARFHLVLNTTGQQVDYQIPDFGPSLPRIPDVVGPDPADPTGTILLETLIGTERWLSVPGGAPTLGDSIVSWTPTASNAGKPYVVVFGGGSLSLLGFELTGGLLLIVSPAQLAMSVNMGVDLADLGSVNVNGALLIDAYGVAGALAIGGQAGTSQTGTGFSLSGEMSLLVNTRSVAVPALGLPEGPYVRVGVSGTLRIGLTSDTSFVMAGNFILTKTGSDLQVTASSTLTAELAGVTLFSMQADGALLITDAGIAAWIQLGTGGTSQMNGSGFSFEGSFVLEVNTTGQEVTEINGQTVSLAAGPYVRVQISGTLALSSAGGNSIGMEGDFDLEMSAAGIAVTADASLFVKLGGSALFSLQADGALLITDNGIAAYLALGTGSSESAAAKGFSFTGYFILELNTGTQPVSEINGVTVNLEAGPYVRLRIAGDPLVADSKAVLQFIIGGASGFLMEGSFTLTLGPQGVAISATTTVKALLAGQPLLSIDASGALLVTSAGIAARIDISAGSLDGSSFSFSGAFTLMVNTTSAVVQKINDVDVQLSAGPYVYLAVTGSVSLPDAAALSLSGAFSIAASPDGLHVFVDASLKFGPRIEAFNFTAIGVLIINADGAAGDFDVNMTIGSGLSSVLAAADISARVVFNTTGVEQGVAIPAEFLPSLGQETRSRLVLSSDGSGLMMYVVSAGAPLLDGTTASPGPYIVATFSAKLTFAGIWHLDGSFRLAAGAGFFELSADASLDMLFLGDLDASGFVSITAAGVAGRFAVDGGLSTVGFSLTVSASFEVNTTGATVDGVEPGYRVSFVGTASFLGFCDASATGLISIDASSVQMYFSGTFTIGPLSFDAAAYVGVFTSGIVMEASVSFKTNILSLFDFDFKGMLQINTTGSDVSGFSGPNGYVAFSSQILRHSFKLDVQATLNVLAVITIGGRLEVVVANGGWSIDIPGTLDADDTGLSASLLGMINMRAFGHLDSDGHFALTFFGQVGLPYSGASTGIDGRIWLSASFDGTTFHFSAGGSFSAKLADVNLVGVAVSLSASGTLGQSVSLDLSVSGTGWVLETVMKIVRMTLDAAEELGVTIINFLGSIGCEIASWFGACDQWVDVQVPSTEWVEKLLSFTIHLATIQLPGSLQNASPPPPDLADLSGGVLTLNVGSRASLRNVQKDNRDETCTITHVGGTAGNETVVVTIFGLSETYTGVSSIAADFGDGNDSFLAAPGVLSGATIYGGSGNDSLSYSGSGSAALYGGEGDDVLALGSGVAGGSLHGGSGDDQLTAEITGAVGVSLYGEDANDTLTGGTGADFLDGGNGNDILQGRGGADSMAGGSGDDTLIEYLAGLGQGATFDGGAGTDQVKFLGSSGADAFQASAYGTSQARLSSCSGSTEVGYLLASSVESLIMDGQGGADSFAFIGNLRQAGIASVTMNLSGDAAADHVDISLSAQDDVLKLSDNTSTANSLTATWVGHTAYNMLSISSQDTLTVRGGAGNDLLCGDTVTYSPFGQIALYGEDGNDVLCGTNQNDLLDGGLGNDTMSGKGGLDIFQDAGGYNTLGEVWSGDFGLFGNLFIEGNAQLTGSGESRELVGFSNATVENIAGIFSEVKLVGSQDSNVFVVGAAAGAVNANGSAWTATPWNGLAWLNGVGGDDEYLVELRGCDGATVHAFEYSQMQNGVVTQPAGGNDVLTIKGTGTADTGTITASGNETAFTLQQGGTTASSVVTNTDIELNLLYLLGGNDVLTVESISVAALVDAGAGNDTVSVRSIQVPFTVSTGAGDDTVNVGSYAPVMGGTVGGIVGQLVVDAGDGTDVLNVDAAGDAADSTGFLTPTDLTGLGMGAGIHYLAFEQLFIGLGSGNDTFTIADTHDGETTLWTNDGSDTVNVLATSGLTNVLTGAGNDVVNVQSIEALTSIAAGAGDDTVNVGSPDGTLGGIVGQLVVDGGDGTDVLNVDDSGDAADRTGLLTPTDLTGLGMGAGIQYLAFEQLFIGLGSGNDTFTIADTHNGETTLCANDGNDTVNVLATSGLTCVLAGAGDDVANVSSDAPADNGTLENIRGMLVVDCGQGINTLNVSDESDATGDTVIITDSSITGFSPAPILYVSTGGTFGGGINIEGGFGGNFIEIQSTNDSTGATTTLWSGEGSDHVLVSETDPISLVIHGEAGDDVICAAVVITDLIITGDAGNDFIISGSGNDWITGNDGDDVIIAGLGSDTVSGNAGNDLIVGDQGIVAWADGRVTRIETANPSRGGDDSITGDGGNDIIFGGAGNDIILGGEGEDALLGDNGLAAVTAGGFSYAGATITCAYAEQGSNGGNDEIRGGAGDDLIMGEQGDDRLFGDDGDDDIIGGSNVRFGVDGNDFVDGGEGADAVLGDNGTICRRPADGQVGTWQRYPAPFADVIRDVTPFDDADGVAGNDVLRGGAGNDVLYGQRGNDVIYGGAGDDELIGGLGSDALAGEDGNDIAIGDTGTITRAWSQDGSPRLNPDGSWHKDVLLADVGIITAVYYPDAVSCADLNAGLLTNLLGADLVLVTGAYNADGGPYLVGAGCKGKEWQTCLVLVKLLPDGDDTLEGGAGNDALFGGRGNDSLAGQDGNDFLAGGTGDDLLEGGSGNDVLVGDDAVRATSGDGLPEMQRGIHLIGTAGNIVMSDLGTTIIPAVSVVPGSTADVLSGMLGYLSGAPALPASSNRLLRSDGTWLLPFASLVTDVAHHTGILPGNDRLIGGDGDDLLVGDNLTVFSPTVVMTDSLLESTEDLARDLSHATKELGELACRLDCSIDASLNHGCISHCSEVIDQVYRIGCDQLDGGTGNDLLVGDSMRVLSPSFVVPLGRLQELDELTDRAQNLNAGFEWAFAEIDEASHDLREVFVSVKCGRKTELNLERHIDQIVAGNDSILGSDGNDLIVGDQWTVISPRLLVTAGGGICHHHSDCDFGWQKRGGDDGSRDHWITGNDFLDGGAGNDTIFGDSAAYADAEVSFDPVVCKCASSCLRHTADDVLEDLLETGLACAGSTQWLHVGGCDGGLFLSRSTGNGCGRSGSGNDVIRGGDGDDLLLGQGGDDVLEGGPGNDWLIGGDGHDCLNGGPGCDRGDYGWGCCVIRLKDCACLCR